ncbi:Ger(x)C family spore germination protein [Paenibacillus chartarius]|uniref:Ger(X)C family spore germination protein n=1 Tax=Paenibacillus chartarius TaxID=747481 RepID=A0ABV6DQL7_9BACL
MKLASTAGRSIACICLFASILPLAGCWDRTEVNDLALVTGAGIDKKDGTIELSVQVFIPKTSGGSQGMGSNAGKGQSGGGQTFVRAAKGITIADAMSRLQEELPRKLFWGHTDIFIFGEKLAREGISDHLDFILRVPQTRERADILVSQGSAKSVLELMPPLERASSEALREMAKSKLGVQVTVIDLTQMLSGESGAAVLPMVQTLGSDRNPGNREVPYIFGTAVLKKDRFVGQIDDKITRGMLILRNEIKNAVITAKVGSDDELVSFYLLNSRTELFPQIKDGAYSVTAKIEAEANVLQNTSDLDLGNPDVNQALEEEIKDAIRSRVQLALDKAQKDLKADIFDFSEIFHRKFPREWKAMKGRWNEIFPQVDVQLDIRPIVRRPGMITSGGNRPKDEVKKQ